MILRLHGLQMNRSQDLKAIFDLGYSEKEYEAAEKDLLIQA